MINQVFFIVAFGVTLALTPVLRRLALSWSLLDIPNERSSHSVPTPRSGGYAIIAGIVIAMILPGLSGTSLVWIAGGAAVIAVTGAVDDRLDLKEWQKLLAQILAATVVIIGGDLFLRSLPIPLVGIWELGGWGVFITSLWIIGFTNAFNFMDGINGIASSQAVVSGVTLSLMFATNAQPVPAMFGLAIAGGCAGFLPWNLSGSIFMGDVGSATLGFLLACLAIQYSVGGGSFIVVILPMLPFIADTSLTLVRRIARGERFYSAHRSHFYQRLNQLGWSHARVTALWTGLAICGGAVAIVWPMAGPELQWTLLGVLTLIHGVVFLSIALVEGRMARASS